MATLAAAPGACLRPPPPSDALLYGGIAVLGVVLAAVLAQVNAHVPEPYMDEVFHVPQTQKYCDGSFDEWDPKITTFPGLYVFGTLLSRSTALLGLSTAISCSTATLRGLNVLFSLGNTLLLAKLRRQLVPSDPNALLHALMIAAFPVHVFFSALFYTDNGAAFFVLLMYSLAERVNLLLVPAARGSYVLSALASLSGAIAVLFRQTNIVWVLFVAGSIVVRCVEFSHGSFIYGSSKEEARHSGTSVIRNSARRVFINFLLVVVSNFGSIVLLVWPFVAVVASFVLFLVWNGGIVVGDKSNHEAGFHGAQLLYCVVVVSTGFGLSLLSPSNISRFLDSISRNSRSLKTSLFMAAFALGTVATIWQFSPVHPFMLADNRHYTFYVWSKFFLRHPLAKFVPTPAYLYLGWRCWIELRRRRSPLWKLVYAVAVSLVLIPSPLVEPRYYLLPFMLFHLNTGHQPPSTLWTTIAGYTLVNTVTLYVFTCRPYEWVDGSTARFMW